MNVVVEIVAMRTRIQVRVIALTTMNPTTLVQNAKDLNVTVGMVSQVFEINLHVHIISLQLTNNSQATLNRPSSFPVSYSLV